MRLLIAVYNGRIISLKVITLSSGPRRLHFSTTGKKWAFHVVDAQWEWMDRLTEPLIGVRRSWLLSGWSEWSGVGLRSRGLEGKLMFPHAFTGNAATKKMASSPSSYISVPLEKRLHRS